MDSKQLFYDKCKIVKRKGFDDLLFWIENKTDYFTSPASTKWHNAFSGGLLKHNFDLFKIYNHLTEKYSFDISEESIFITSMFHDLCKTNSYRKTFEGTWTWIEKEDRRHSGLSIDLLKNHIELTQLENDMIFYHMGMYGTYGRYKEYEMDELVNKFEDFRIKAFYFADDMASHLK